MSLSKTKRANRKHREMNIGATPPEKKCEDVKCPWHGDLALRGRIFIGEVVSSKTKNTTIVEWKHTHYMRKYERYERRHTKIAAYNPLCIDAKKGDTVKIMECRPISKTKSFVVVEVLK